MRQFEYTLDKLIPALSGLEPGFSQGYLIEMVEKWWGSYKSYPAGEQTYNPETFRFEGERINKYDLWATRFKIESNIDGVVEEFLSRHYGRLKRRTLPYKFFGFLNKLVLVDLARHYRSNTRRCGWVIFYKALYDAALAYADVNILLRLFNALRKESFNGNKNKATGGNGKNFNWLEKHFI